MSDLTYLAAGFLIAGAVLTLYVARLWWMQRDIARRIADLDKKSSPPPAS